HLDRPIGYTMDDAADYKLGFLVDNPKEFMAGNIIYNFDDFNNFISEILNNEDRYKEKRRLLFEKIWKYRDGNSCERLVKHMGIKE
ncbi:MAG: CDP-glycerol glycerophosphotransferase family protein, partial [Bacillota bacterium]|nr:CDP-glycerol glycerophosphotransferase family protein [Bacillota bacterium]